MGQFTNYYSYVQKEAQFLFNNNREDLFNEVENDEVDVHEFFDDKVHSWVDSDFIYIDLHDCADILDSSDNVETDSGLWEGSDPVDAVKAMAFFTYRNDLMEAVREVAKEELEDKKKDVESDIEDHEGEKKRLESKRVDLETEQEDLDEDDEDYDEEYDRLEQEIDEVDVDIDLEEEKISDLGYVVQYIEDTIDNI